MSVGDDNSNHGTPGRSAYWLSWMLGAAILVAVVIAALHVAEGRELIDVAGRAKPRWLVLAVCLQGATYVAQGEIFRRVPRAASMVINIASYHAAYVMCLGVALAITTSRGETRLPVLLVSVLFLAFSVTVTVGLVFLSGRDVDRIAAKLQRFSALRNALVFLKDADRISLAIRNSSSRR